MAIGETFLSAFLQVLFEQMLSTGGKKFLKLIGGVDLPKTINKWKIQLTLLEALLEDAELQQFHSKPVKLWLNELQDLAYDMEDILDHFAIEARRYELEKAEEDQVNAVDDHSHHGILDNMVQTIYASGSRAAGSLSTLFKPVDQDIQDKIQDISERLQDIQAQTHSLSLTAAHMLQQQTLQTETIRRQRESTSLVGKVFGRDDKKQEIITMLLKGDQSAENYAVIPIIGTGGIGKTTLAQYVYNDKQLNGYFDLKAWVCVSDVFDVKRVTIDIINSVTKSSFDCSNLDQAQVKLQEVLNKQKFLIVLDDIWSDEYDDWYKLQEPFQHGAEGSRVIMTTRIESIAMMMVNNPTQRNIIKLESLSKDDCWLIFQQHAKVDSDLTDLRDVIIEKIDGLPLAAKALGGLLKSIADKNQHRKILESKVWGEKSSVLPVLRLSYHHMPHHLKRVFAYCSVFPKDYVFKEVEVVLLWMAQGFLPETQTESMEDMGHKYLNDLLSRSLFEKSRYGEGKFIMHDLIHDMAQWVAGEVCYVADADTLRSVTRIRHLFISKKFQTLGNEIMVPQLRTFLCNSNLDLRFEHLDLFKNFHYIRTLGLYSYVIEALPEYIGDLKHLCYLSLGFKRIKVLPQSVGNLWNLQTLCLEGCYKLEKIPYIGLLVRLRHLNIDDTCLKEMPPGIGKLTNLQTLQKFIVTIGGGSRVRELGKLNQLHGRLFIVSGLENVTDVEDAEEAQLCKKENLDGLNLKWGACTDEVDDQTRRDVVELLRPHTSVNKCELDGYMGSRFPSWLGDPSFISMVGIELVKCEKCEWLPPLGQLRSLKSLRIRDMNGIKEVGLEFYGNCSTPPFPSLKTLKFSDMKSWEKWVHPTVDYKAFSILETLYMDDCPSLQGNLPPHLPSLTKLKISELKNMERLTGQLLNFPSLEGLEIRECPKLHSLGEGGLPRNLRYLEICEANIEQVPEGGSPTNLLYLSIIGTMIDKPIKEWGFHLLTSLSTLVLINVGSCVTVECISYHDFPSSLLQLSIAGFQNLKTICCSTLPKLSELYISFCPKLESFGDNGLPHLPSLTKLIISELKNMERLAGQLLNFTSLKELEIRKCPKLHSLAEGDLPRNLRSLEIREADIQQAVTEWELHLLHSLKILRLINVGSSVDFSCPHFSLPSSLSELQIEGFQNLITISSGSTLPNLTHLSIKNCPKLCNFLEGGLPTNLKEITIRGTKIDKPIKEWGLHLLTSLEDLRLTNVGSCADTVECISYPDFPSSLNIIWIEGFQNLKTICCSTLPELGKMNIKNCPKLESFGDNGLPPHIKWVHIKECDMIEQQLTSDPNGRIRINYRRFSLPLSGSQPSSADSTC